MKKNENSLRNHPMDMNTVKVAQALLRKNDKDKEIMFIKLTGKIMPKNLEMAQTICDIILKYSPINQTTFQPACLEIVKLMGISSNKIKFKNITICNNNIRSELLAL